MYCHWISTGGVRNTGKSASLLPLSYRQATASQKYGMDRTSACVGSEISEKISLTLLHVLCLPC